MQISSITAAVRNVSADKKGVTAIEYGMIAALIIVVCLVAIASLGTTLNAKFGAIIAAM